jgi:hypothetical protein
MKMKNEILFSNLIHRFPFAQFQETLLGKRSVRLHSNDREDAERWMGKVGLPADTITLITDDRVADHTSFLFVRSWIQRHRGRSRNDDRSFLEVVVKELLRYFPTTPRFLFLGEKEDETQLWFRTESEVEEARQRLDDIFAVACRESNFDTARSLIDLTCLFPIPTTFPGNKSSVFLHRYDLRGLNHSAAPEIHCVSELGPMTYPIQEKEGFHIPREVMVEWNGTRYLFEVYGYGHFPYAIDTNIVYEMVYLARRRQERPEEQPTIGATLKAWIEGEEPEEKAILTPVFTSLARVKQEVLVLKITWLDVLSLTEQEKEKYQVKGYWRKMLLDQLSLGDILRLAADKNSLEKLLPKTKLLGKNHFDEWDSFYECYDIIQDIYGLS